MLGKNTNARYATKSSTVHVAYRNIPGVGIVSKLNLNARIAVSGLSAGMYKGRGKNGEC